MSDSQSPNASFEDAVYDRIHRKTWARRTSGFLAGATMFGAFGAAGGAIISVLPYLLGGMGVAGAAAVASPTLGAILGTTALFAGAAATLGITIGGDVGVNAAAASATIDERNRNLKDMGLGDLAKGKSQSPETDEKETVQSLVKKYNWKAGLVLAGVFAAFGALVALSPLTAPVVGLMGLQAGSVAASITCAATLGMLGSTMGVPFSAISNRLSNSYHHLLTNDGSRKQVAHDDAPAQLHAHPKPHLHAVMLIPAQPQQPEAAWSTRVSEPQARQHAEEAPEKIHTKVLERGYAKLVRSKDSQTVSQESETIVIR